MVKWINDHGRPVFINLGFGIKFLRGGTLGLGH